MTDREVVDLGEVILVHNEECNPELWLGPVGTSEMPRLVEAFARGQVTVGGLAEAGWHSIGKLNDDGVIWKPSDGLGGKP